MCSASGTIAFRSTGLLSTVAVGRSLQKLVALVSGFDPVSFIHGPEHKGKKYVSALFSTSEEDRDITADSSKLKVSWLAALESTQWLEGIRQLLITTMEAVKFVLAGEPVRAPLLFVDLPRLTECM